MLRRRKTNHPSILEALYEAQKIAFSPFIFEACVAAKRMGLLAAIDKAEGGEKASEENLAKATNLTLYAVGALADALEAAGVLTREKDPDNKAGGDRLSLTKTGECLLYDAMTSVNLDFTADVCYAGLQKLSEAFRTGRPEGLKALMPAGNWETIYPALSSLPEPARTSWFAFDHYYSDRYFDALAEKIARTLAPARLFDVGGNTGKFARAMLAASETMKVALVDLPQQCRLAQENPALTPFADRFSTASVNWLEPEAMPVFSAAEVEAAGADVIWMSQFLECFPAEMAVSILKRCRKLLAPNGCFAVLECLVDGQPHRASNLSIAASSLYFTALANGNSRFYRRADLMAIFEAAGLAVAHEEENVGVSHTLFVLRPKKES